MRIFKDRCIFMKEVIEDAKNIKEGENGKIKEKQYRRKSNHFDKKVNSVFHLFI